MKNAQHDKHVQQYFTDTYKQRSSTSYSGHSKSAVLAQWNKSLQKQQFEEACHWTAELDISHWHKDLWQKIITFTSKHVHLHCPKLPLIVARNFAYYQIFLIQHHHQDRSECQPRNQPQLRQNLCQVIGLLSLSSKGPVYTIPSVDIQKIDASELVSGTHAWLMPFQSAQDDSSVLRIVSTLLCQLEMHNTHKVMYWLGILIEYDKYKKQLKESVQMASRKPILPNDSCYKHVFVHGSHACDWVWLVWHAVLHGCVAMGKPKACVDTLKALGYLFSFDYTTSKRNARMPILIHALQLVYTDVQWNKSVYTNQTEPLIDRACHNFHILYKDIYNTKQQNTERFSNGDRSHPADATSSNTTVVTTQPPAQTTLKPPTKPSAKSTKSRASKHTMSSDSISKIDTFNKIDAVFLGL